MKRLLFSRVDVEIFEDIDFPEDPAPYVRIAARDADVYLELEEAADLGRALTQWVQETEERDRRRGRDARRKIEQLDDAARDALSDAAAICRSTPPAVMTLLELLVNARKIDDGDEHRPPGPQLTRRRRRRGSP
jgi:hypothetical protein